MSNKEVEHSYEIPIGTLEIGEIHPASHVAMEYIKKTLADNEKLFMLQEGMASCALSGNKLAEVCGETLRRLLASEPISDRYLMGLAWFIYDMEENENEN